MKALLTFRFLMILAFSITATFSNIAQANSLHRVLCYLPGAGGGSDFSLKQLPGVMAKRGVELHAFDLLKKGSVQFKAEILRKELEKIVQQDPDFRCDFVAYSQGGIVARYAFNHLRIRHPQLGEVFVAELATSLTTMAAPHAGTPLARIGAGIIGPDLDEGMRQLTEENIVHFNDPAYPATYSPMLDSMDNFSYRTYMKNGSEAKSLPIRLGFEAIKKDLAMRGLRSENDGVVPLSSQDWGQLLGTFQLPHTFFSDHLTNGSSFPDLLDQHARFLKQNQSAISEPAYEPLSAPLLNTF